MPDIHEEISPTIWKLSNVEDRLRTISIADGSINEKILVDQIALKSMLICPSFVPALSWLAIRKVPPWIEKCLDDIIRAFYRVKGMTAICEADQVKTDTLIDLVQSRFRSPASGVGGLALPSPRYAGLDQDSLRLFGQSCEEVVSSDQANTRIKTGQMGRGGR
jgi:hypothetical protein